MKAIEITGLEHIYKGAAQPALNGLDLQIPKGSFFGLLGPNGAGKTTAISIISGLIEPSSGSLTFAGKSWKDNPMSIKQTIGLVPQEIALYEALTATENLNFFASMLGLEKSILKSRVDELFEKFGLNEHQGKPISSYSGGMKRRVNLMVALLHTPEILILDEPTVGVDVHSRNLINSYLKELNEAGMTMIYTSHQLEETEKLCDRMAIIDHGKLIAEGQTSELLSKVEGSNLNDLFIHLTGTQTRD